MKELSPPALNLKRLVKETVPGEPILIVISPGADPSQVSLHLGNQLVLIKTLCYALKKKKTLLVVATIFFFVFCTYIYKA